MIIIENVFKYGSPIYAEVVYGTSSGGGAAATWGTITGTITNQTDLVSYVANRVPYTGATSDVNLGEFGVQLGNIEFDNTPTGIPSTAGSVYWSDQEGTIGVTLKGANINAKVAQDLYARVVNKVGSNLTKANYRALKITTPQGQRLAINLAQGNNDTNSADTIGINAEDIANNQEGFIITFGQITGINTTGSLFGETWADGDVLYLSPTTAGYLTNVKPLGQHIVVLGYVEYSHANNGKIFVKVMNGWELDELHDVNITSPTNGQALTYNSTLQKWVNTTLGGGSGTVTSVSVVNANGFNGSVANATTTPAITLTTTITGLLKGNGTAISAAVAGTDFQSPITLTTTGSSGAATFISNTLNVPNYTLAGLGGQASSSNLTSLSGLTYVSSSFVKMTGANTFTLDTNTYLTGNETITLSGDVTGSGAIAISTTISNNAVTNAKLAQVATATFKGRTTAGTGNVEDLSSAQATALLDVFTSTLQGVVPASAGGTTNFLRADGTWAAPGGSGITSLNGLTAATQTFATGTSGTDFNISSSTSTHTFNIPDASLTARGLVNTGSQSFTGQKTIRGTGTTSATSSFFVEDSAGGAILQCRNDKVVFIGNNTAGGTLQNNTQLRFVCSGNTNGSFTFNTGTSSIANNQTLILSATTATASSGANDINYLTLTGALNTTSTSTSIIRDIYLNHTFTSVTGSYRGLDIVAPATATGGGTITYLQCRTASADIFVVQPTTITIGDAVNFAFNTSTGTKLGTSTSQKISFYNATPIVQPTTATAAATFVANTGTAVNDASTFDGYTLGSAIKALRNLGILA